MNMHRLPFLNAPDTFICKLGLPYYIGGCNWDKEELTLQTPESIWNRFRIDMKVHHEITDINAVKENSYSLQSGYRKSI